MLWRLAAFGTFTEGITHAEAALRIAGAVGHPYSLIRAYDLYQAMDMTYWLPRAEAALAGDGHAIDQRPKAAYDVIGHEWRDT